jgi:hypothetical protein
MRRIPHQPPGHTIAYFPALSPVVGGSNAAILLCQLIYWTPRAKDPDGWIYKTQLAIIEECGLSRDEQRTARKALKARGLISERYDRLRHQLYFQVNLEAYNAIVEGLYDETGDEPKPWKINQVRKTYIGKSGNHISPYTEIARRHIRKPDIASTSSEIPETTTEIATGSLSQKGKETTTPLASGVCVDCGIVHQPRGCGVNPWEEAKAVV